MLLIPARAAGIDPDVLPQDYQRLVAFVREAAEPVTVRAVGEVLGLPGEVRGKLEPLRAKLNRRPTISINHEYKNAMLRA